MPPSSRRNLRTLAGGASFVVSGTCEFAPGPDHIKASHPARLAWHGLTIAADDATLVVTAPLSTRIGR
jgi:hypothetical protein